MKCKKYRLFVNYKKEEDWINSMERQGLHFVDYAPFGRYLFEKGEPEEYIYRLELLDNPPAHPDSAAYITFMEENGIECVCTYMRWVYFRKKAADGAFEIYSDSRGKINHAKRILALSIPLLALNLFSAIINLWIGLERGGLPGLNAYLSIINFVVFWVLAAVVASQGKLVYQLKKEERIRE